MAALVTGTVLGGKYVLERLIGSGGMGAVWLCHHKTLDAPFAIKLLRPELALDEAARERFEREAKASAALRTRHVVKVHDHGVDGDHPYMVMELLEGEDLRTRLKRQGRLSRRETCDVVVQAARALHYAHAAGIVHRDLKPANIFMASIDGEEVVKILDFGIAKMVGVPKSGAATQTGTLLGSPHYMSPEQIRGHWSMVDHRTDLWALAVVAFRSLTGQLPFLGDVVGDVMIKVCTDPIPTPSSIAPDLSPQIDELFARALERDRDKRFRSGLELATELARALGQQLDALDPTWITPAPGESVPGLAPRDGFTAATRVTPEVGAGGSIDLSRDTTLPLGGGGSSSEAPAAAGTLTDLGSLQVGARRADLPRQYLLWVGISIVVAALGAGALIMAQDSDPPEPAGAESAPTEPASTEPMGEPSFRPAEVVAEQVEPDGAATASTAEPDSSASAQVATSKPANPRPAKPAASPRPKSEDSFSDRFGYD